MPLNFDKIRDTVREAGEHDNNREFLRLLLEAYDFPKSTFARIVWPSDSVQRGVYIQNKIFYVNTISPILFPEYDVFKRNGLTKIHADYLLIANAKEILACNLKTSDVLNCSKQDLHNRIEFFYPLLNVPITAELESSQSIDIATAEKFAALFNEMVVGARNDQILVAQFLTRLLLCCFLNGLKTVADEEIANLVKLYTDDNGSDLGTFFDNLFHALKTESTGRRNLPGYFQKVRCCDQRLFPEELSKCVFSKESRHMIVELLDLNWQEITPEILGACIQSISCLGSNLGGVNYTETANIQKLIGPLFMNGLYQEFTSAKSISALLSLYKRIHAIKILDPACGTGNFLLVTYRELTKLNELIAAKIRKMDSSAKVSDTISAKNFYGIEESPLACQIAKLGFFFSSYRISKSIRKSVDSFDDVQIYNEDSLTFDWRKACKVEDEIYVIGNPSYCGANRQTTAQKNKVATVFEGYKNFKNLDMAACWFMLAAKYIGSSNGGFAFVTTNSLTQGTQVDLLWSKLYDLGFYIQFAHTSFKWKNDARNRTSVTVVIIGMRNSDRGNKACELYRQNDSQEVSSISPYLVPGRAIVKERTASLCGLPPMVKGNMPYDSGHLLLNSAEKDELLYSNPDAQPFLRRVVGSDEFINAKERWCIWIRKEDAPAAMKIAALRDRVERVRKSRVENKDPIVKRMAERAYQFRDLNETHKNSIVVPAVYSENYLYPPAGFVFKDTIVTNLASVIYDCEAWVLGIICSQMHNVWIRTVCGKLEERIRYSLKLGYNTFPIPDLNQDQKNLIRKCVFNIIQVRENHPGESLAKLYHKDRMPEDLHIAHKILDEAVDRCYRPEPFFSDEDRRTYLFSMYERLER